MYSRCNYPLQILFVYFLILPSLLQPSILFNCFYTCHNIILLYDIEYMYTSYNIGVYFELVGMMTLCTNNHAASLSVVGEGADALLCNMRYLMLAVTLCRIFI